MPTPEYQRPSADELRAALADLRAELIHNMATCPITPSNWRYHPWAGCWLAPEEWWEPWDRKQVDSPA